MKRNKKNLLIALSCVFIFSNSLHVMAAGTDSSVTQSKHALPQKVFEIAEGSNQIYGNGVPVNHNQYTRLLTGIFNKSKRDTVNDTGQIRGMFGSVGLDHSHQYIVASALTILNNDKGSSVINDYCSTLLENTDWPDIYGNETDYGTFVGHFYDPDSGENYLGSSSPTAKKRAESYYSKAVEAYKNGRIEESFTLLGRGTHYTSDLNEPHHASNKVAYLSKHVEFEDYVDTNRESYRIDGNTFTADLYDASINVLIGDSLKNAAAAAKKLLPSAENESTFEVAASESVKNAIQSQTMYIYRFGKEVGIYK